MNQDFLDFEQPIADLEAKITELRFVEHDSEINIGDEISRLKTKSDALTKSIFSNLSAWQIARLARHPMRPYTLDYANSIFTDFEELHGDRAFADDPAIITAIARLDGQPVAIIGHQKARDTKEKIRRNFGMPKPDIFTFIDTPGAYPGIGAEERGQSEAIAKNLEVMSGLRVPIICTVIGEGGSGGALAIGVGDRVLMLQYGIYSVISPEGCASILWKSPDKTQDAAEAMQITAPQLIKHKLIDAVIEEPLGGAHRDHELISTQLADALRTNLAELQTFSSDELLNQRYEKLRNFGVFKVS